MSKADVLVVLKTSTWDWQGDWFKEQAAKGLLPEWDVQRIKQAHADHQHTIGEVHRILEARKIQYDVVTMAQDWELDHCVRYVVTVGGDGTLLAASHKVDDCDSVVVGIRSSGTSVGYLCAGGLDRLDTLATQIVTNTVPTFSAARLKAEISSTNDVRPKRSTPPVLNDFLFSHKNPAATTRYRVFFDEQFEEHKSSGIWIATALGSSAGIYAAGGIIVPRADQNFQFVVRELYRAPGKNYFINSGFFDADKKSFALENRCDQAILALDGNNGVVPVVYGERIEFKRAKPLRIGI